MRVWVVSVLSWLVGFLAYRAALAVFWHQSLSRGDSVAVLFWSAVAAAIAVPAVYAPVMVALRKRRATALWPYVSAGVGLGIVPVLLIIGIFGGHLRSLVSLEAGLFYCMFGVFGGVFGMGFFLAYRKDQFSSRRSSTER